MTDQRPGPPYTSASGGAAVRRTGAAPLQPGDPARIGPYVPLGRLGSGGMGRVYLARPTGDRRPGLAAVKVIRPEYAEDPEFRRRFEREAAVHARIGAPYAPRLLGTGFADSLLWMATQYLPGLNLTDAVRGCGRLDPAGVWRLVGELGRALSALSAAGIVHRDLKPSNVILSLDGVRVIDFGISRAMDSSAITVTGSRVGTPAYMSPEYLRESRCDTASDVFSLAGTLVYAATGNAPFGDGTGVDVLHRIAFEEPNPEVMAELAAADPRLATLLSACLAKDPAVRPAARQLIDAAAEAAEGPGPSWPEPLSARLLARQQAYEELAQAPAGPAGPPRTPTERVAAPVPGPAFGPATPPGAYRAPTVESRERRRRHGPYFAVAACLAVCAVAVGAYLLTRPPLDGAASPGPTAATGGSTADDALAPLLPLPSASPSGGGAEQGRGKGAGKSAGKGTAEERSDAGAKGEEAGGTRTEPTEGAGGSGAADAGPGGAGAQGGGGGTAAPSPTGPATGPATAPWLSQCTYYSGTELTVYGDSGRRVVQVQCMLTERGYGVGRSGVDGQFGKDTMSAVRRFQSDRGLDVDGDVGAKTWAALRAST
ncbi:MULTISPECIES: protein kinase [unclassified Streptomyces]|uniref:protein kinase domain-containing protein n=1 Tax=unclassified Streptomyces TaxID=2593676 RepID=UPI0036F71024